MKISELFQRSIDRPINGVVKADQLDESSVWQELDEFVVTQELTGYMTDLVAVLLSTIESDASAADKNGVWISGFFGSGKSHFIKVLSYLLENSEHAHDGERRRAVDFFEKKLTDPTLYGDLKKIVATSMDTILFNIDSKADHSTGRDALLRVFLRVLNEKQGFSGDHPHIAHMERHLEEKGRLSAFHEVFEREAGSSWLAERDAWAFRRDEVIAAFSEALEQSRESAEAWVDSAESSLSITVENFAKWVKQYLDRVGEDHRVMFLVDEVGQFIGNNTHLMLNLQTITEELGTICNGRAWVVVTSQEDLDAVLGDVNNVGSHDFSKIQGRFKTRLSLSSANVDEVIKRRLLDKKPEALPVLSAAYEGKEDILRNQLSFVATGRAFKQYAGLEDFTTCYPFAAYQFALVQRVFESIRKAGATGLHLSQGERSTLDAFQTAAKQAGEHEVGALVPFQAFYPAVEGFLEGTVKRTIDNARDNHALEDFDPTVLEILFLIRYVEELPGNVDNLVTLCIEEIDADKLAIRRKVEESLDRLEAQTLIARTGDLYTFLTNEERDIGREIKNQSIPSGAEERELGKLIFEDILNDARKHTYSVTNRDFQFTRLCDDHAIGNRIEGSLEVAFVSPLGDSYAELTDDGRCIMLTSMEARRVLIRLPDDEALGRELRTYLKTDAYVRTKNTQTLPDTTKRILRDRSDDNRARRERLRATLVGLIERASYFASGTKLDISRSDPKAALGDAMEYLIENAYPKMSFIKQLHANPKQEIQSTLRANDVEQVTLALKADGANPDAMEDLREYVRLATPTSKKIVLHELIEKRYGGLPYGWPEDEVVLLVARMAVLKEITLVVDSAPLPLDRAYDYLTTTTKQRQVVIHQREMVDDQLLTSARQLGKDLFGKQGPGSEDGLFEHLKSHLSEWDSALKDAEPLARTGKYPGLAEIETIRSTIHKFVDESDSLRFLKRFVDADTELRQAGEDYLDVSGFYQNQRHSWDLLRNAVDRLTQNRLQLEPHPEAGPALRRMEEILASDRPYGMLAEVAGLSATAKKVNEALLEEARGPAAEEIKALLSEVERELNAQEADGALRETACAELKKLLLAIGGSSSLAHIAEAKEAGDAACDRAVLRITESQVPEPGQASEEEPPPKPRLRRVVTARSLWPGGMLDSQADVDAFLKKLRSELEAAIEADERIQLK